MATKRWLGVAGAVSDVWTISLSGTVTSQIYSMTINGKSVTYTAVISDTIASVLSALATAWNASTIAEFAEATAVAGTSTMTITGDTPGVPLTIAVSTTGSATYSISNTTVATGPNDLAQTQNWSTGTLPANGDTLVFDAGSVDCLYGIGTSLTGVTVLINQGYSGKIGLPQINTNGTNPYQEYRTTNLTFAGGTVTVNAGNIKQCNLAFGANTATVRILNTGSRINDYTPVVLITGGNGSSELDISKGDVALAFYQGQTANFPTIKTGYVASVLTDANLFCGPGSTLSTIVKNGGNLTMQANATTITQDIGGGTLTLSNAVTATTINSYAGTVAVNTIGTIGTINLYGSSTLSMDGDPRAKTFTNPINVYSSDVTVIDTAKTVNSGTLSIAMNGMPSVNYFHGGNATLVLT
jgi:hypothetical protein